MKLSANFHLEKYGLDVRLVTITDAPFIVHLRTNKELSKYLHPISSDVEEQEKWLDKYKLREQEGREYYFIFSQNGQDLGLERIYDIEGENFTHGSLIFSPSAPIGTAILADIITREIAFDTLGLSNNYFDVRKGNVNVRNYHLKYSPVYLHEDTDSYYYLLRKENFKSNKNKFLRLFAK